MSEPLSKEHLPLEPVHADADFSVSRMGDPAAAQVVLCFAGIGRNVRRDREQPSGGLGGIQPAEFLGSAKLRDSFVLHIADIKRSWFNGFDHQRLLGVLQPLVAGKRVVSLGNSMGGFGAIWISKLLPVDTALAFAPQFSVHPEVLPEENRWKRWTKRIEHWQVDSLAECFVPGTRYFTFNGARDRLHWSHFPTGPNATHYLIHGAHHRSAVALKDAGVLQDTIRACVFDGNPLAEMRGGGLRVKAIGAKPRDGAAA